MSQETGRAFLAEARRHLRADYLPKIERCLERLTDEQVWWRASEHSNSVGLAFYDFSSGVPRSNWGK